MHFYMNVDKHVHGVSSVAVIMPYIKKILHMQEIYFCKDGMRVPAEREVHHINLNLQ